MHLIGCLTDDANLIQFNTLNYHKANGSFVNIEEQNTILVTWISLL
jgi:hypothetical protein